MKAAKPQAGKRPSERKSQRETVRPIAQKFEGRWRIIEMLDFDQETIDEDVPAFIEFGKNGSGEFQFVLVQGEIDARFAKISGSPCVAFCWAGHDECDETTGRGEATIEPDGTLAGTFFVFQSDSYSFKAEKASKGKAKARARR